MKEILRATGNVQQAWEATNLEKIRASLNLGIAQQNLSAVQATEETQVRSLGQEDPPEEDNGNPLQYSCQGISKTEEPGGYSPKGRRVRYN